MDKDAAQGVEAVDKSLGELDLGGGKISNRGGLNTSSSGPQGVAPGPQAGTATMPVGVGSIGLSSPSGGSIPADPAAKNRGARGRGVDFPLRLLVASDMVGAIIGRGGATIRTITQQSRARVDVHSLRKLEHSAALEKAITVYGQPENCTQACRRIMEVMEEEARNVGKPAEISLKILAHNNLIGRIIGKNGGTIKKIMEDTDTKITVSSISDISSFNLERVITIKGSIPDIARAEAEVSSKLRAAYETDLQAMAPQSVMFPGLHPAAMMSTVGLGSPHPGHTSYRPGVPPTYPGPPGGQPSQGPRPPPQQIPQETTYLYIPNAAVGAIIGTKGSHIRNIIKFSGSTVKIASQDEEEDLSKLGGVSSIPGGGTTQGAPVSSEGVSTTQGEASSPGVATKPQGGPTLGSAPVSPVSAPAPPGQEFSSPPPSETQRRVTIVGGPEAQWKAQYLIFEKLREEGFSSGVEDVRLTVEILVPSVQVGRIIGKGGQNVREMQRLTGAVIKLPEQGTSTGEETSVHIIGPFYSTQSAQRRIRAMVCAGVLPAPGGQSPHHPVPPLLPNGGGAGAGITLPDTGAGSTL